MSILVSSSSPVAKPQRYHTLPTLMLSQAEQQDRWLKTGELEKLRQFFQSGAMLLTIADTLNQNAAEIISIAASRIFVWGEPMAYLEPLPNRVDLPGANPWSWQKSRRSFSADLPQKFRYTEPGAGLKSIAPVQSWLEGLKLFTAQGLDPVPDKFYRINVFRYGTRNMKKSMRDIAWFLRYVIYAIVAGDSSILAVNARGLRGVIPENVTAATVVAIQTMKWKSMSYFKQDQAAQEMIRHYFDVLITEYQTESPTGYVRQGVSLEQQGLKLPETYKLTNVRPKFVIKPGMAPTEQQEAIQAAYRQVFERDVTRAYGIQLKDLESQVKGGQISVREFIRRLGKSRLYRQEFYAPFTISRVIELAVRHFLGRGLHSIEEFQTYFDVITPGGLAALIDVLVDSQEYSNYFGEEMVPYLRGLEQEAQACRNWGVQFGLFNFGAQAEKVPQFITLFGRYRQPMPNQHPYGAGHDPLEIQFGAVFPAAAQVLTEHPAFFNVEHRRILIQTETGDSHQLGRVPGAGTRSLKFSPVHAGQANVNLYHHSPEAVILGAYRQVLGGDIYAGQRLLSAETRLKSSEITVREFIRQVGKSRLFRKQAWESLYITKAIEYIHRRLLGRPTYGRAELSRYYDLCAKQGFYALIDALMDSPEYIEVFGEDTVPYERYVTPRGLAMRSPLGSGDSWRNGFAGSSRRPVEQIPSALPAVEVSEGGQAWTYMMQVANQRSPNGHLPQPFPPPAAAIVADLMASQTEQQPTDADQDTAGLETSQSTSPPNVSV